MVDRDRDLARRGARGRGRPGARSARGRPAGGLEPARDGSELVIRHDRPCYVTGARPAANPGAPASETANDQIDGELRTLASRHRIDAIRTSKGRRVPASTDEQARLDADEAGRARLAARRVQLPRGTLGDTSVFDGQDTYAQLALQVDPPEVMTQAQHIVELVKPHGR